MDVVSLSPLRVGSVVWQPRTGTFRLTVVVKATFDLAPGEATLSETQEDLNEDDNHWNDDPARSLYSPSDLAPFKMRADVLLVGHAFAPRGEPVRSLIARLLVAELDKAIEVVGNRSIKGGALEEPAPFTRMPLRYERAAGGADTMNPVGIAPDAPPDPSGAVPVANIFPVGGSAARPSGFVEPVGFGPIASSWPFRWAQLGPHASTWDRDRVTRAPLPEDIELGYFNSAPRDQQIEAIRDNERIVLEHLQPEHPQLVTRLPGLHPRVFVDRPGRPPEELAMRADTLWIDTDRNVCTLAWRGQIALETRDEPGRVLVALEDARQRLAWADVERMPPRASKVQQPQQAQQPQPMRLSSVVPTAPGAKGGLGGAAKFLATPAPALAPGGGTLARKKPATAPPVRVDGAPPAHVDVGPPARLPRFVDEPSLPTMDITAARALNPVALANALPFTPVAPAAGADRSGPSVRTRSADDHTATEEPPGLSGSMPAWLASSPASSPRPEMPAHVEPPQQAEPPRPAVERAKPQRTPSPTPTAHNAEHRAPRPPDLVELLHIDPLAPSRLRSALGFAPMLELGKASGEEDASADGTAAARQKVYAMLARGTPVDVAEVGEALARAIGPDGTFTAPVLLVAGDLELGFGEIDVLRATLAALAPLLPRGAVAEGADKALVEVATLAETWLERHGGDGANSVAEALTARILEAVNRGTRLVPAGYLEAHTERIGLERRAYPLRALLGDRWIRASIIGPSSAVTAPAYLPLGAAARLPLFRRFAVRALVEAHPRQDQFEGHPACLRVLAIARCVPAPIARR